MPLSKFRSQIIYVLFFSKIAVLLVLFFHWAQSKFQFSHVKELLFIILPLFTVYLTLLMKFTMDEANELETEAKQVKGPIVIIGRTTPIFFAFYMIAALTFPPAGALESFNQMKEMIGWGEIIFGFYIGYVIQAIIQKSVAPKNQEERIIASLDQIQSTLHRRPFLKSPVGKAETRELAEIKGLLSKGKIRKAINQLKDYVQSHTESDDLLNQLINLSGQYYQYQEQRRLNLTNDHTIPNRVVAALLEIITELESV